MHIVTCLCKFAVWSNACYRMYAQGHDVFVLTINMLNNSCRLISSKTCMVTMLLQCWPRKCPSMHLQTHERK